MRRIFIAALLVTVAPLAACSSVSTALNGPKMSAMSYPSALVPSDQQVLSIAASARDPMPQPASANSLWRTGARQFFHDQRAARVGDIITVLVNINDSASISNATAATKTGTNKMGITNLFGLESSLGRILPKAYDPTSAIN